MDDRLLLGIGSADSQTQHRVTQYFEELKQSADGWQLCLNAIATNSYAGNDHVRFFCFQVIEHYLKTRYANANSVEQQCIRGFLKSWIQGLNGAVEEKSFILNKAAQLFVFVCFSDYPCRWPTLFHELNDTLRLGSGSVDMYLRVLQAIDDEVADREINHGTPELQRNTLIKDTMRQECITTLVDAWYQILLNYETLKPALACACLKVVGAYVSWIDIGLIANDRFVPVFLRFMTQPLLRESTCDCIHEIISKGMDPIAKTKLIESFASVLNSAGILSVGLQEDDGDYLAKLARLINGMGLQLTVCWQKLVKSHGVKGAAQVTFEALESKVPFMLKFLGSEDDDVSGTISPFAHDYMTLLKQMLPLDDKHRAIVQEILYIIIRKMKYDSSFNFESGGEEEAMFQEYRKELRVIYNNLGALDSELLLRVVSEVFTQTITRWQVAEFQDVEVAITLLYQLAEALPASNSQHFTGDLVKVSILQDMMKLLMTSGVSCYQHPSVSLQFFETVIRYDKFFSLQPQFIPDVLMAFNDNRGLWNPSAHVRSRASYLFSRFVKSVNKVHLQPYLESMLGSLQGLLVLHTPYNGIKQQLSPEDQQFLYETASILIVQSQFPPQKKQELMRKLLMPIVTKFDELLQLLMTEADEGRQVACAISLTQAMGYASRTSKGFSSQQTVKLNDCTEVYTDMLRVFLGALGVPVQRPILHQGVRQFLHRMVVCLDASILPFIPIAMENLLKYADMKQMHDFIPFINQVVQKFKADIIPFLQQVFMPIVSTIFQVLASSVDERDQVTQNDRKMLQRGYFSFISALVTNNVAQVLSNQSSQDLHQVLMTVIRGAVDIPDPVGQKTCFSILRKTVELWGDKNQFNGFEDFMYKNIVPACFLAPLKPTFDLSDGQTVIALNESAACIKGIHEKRGDEFIQYLQTTYLMTINISPPVAREFCQALHSNNKIFQNYFKAFILQAKS